MASWRASLGVMASRGEISGPRVEQARAALANWKLRAFLMNECGYSAARADALVDSAAKTPGAPR
jgi:hypothetical protein